MGKIILYTDGSCDPHNTKCGGFAVIQQGKEEIVKCGSKRNTTNNEMELTAIYQAIKWLNEKNINHCEIKSDSQYAIQSITKWIDNWIWNGENYRKRNGDIVKNSILIHNIVELLKKSKTSITFTHVKGHKNDQWNNFADLVANDMRELEEANESYLEMRSTLHNEIGALDVYESENVYTMTFQNINVQIVQTLEELGFHDIKIQGIADNKVKIECIRG